MKDASHIAGNGFSPWTDERVFHSGDAFFGEIVRSIDSAHRSIEVETFIFAKDSLGSRIADALERAALRGLRVRLCVDGIGSWRFDQDLWNRLKHAGVECKIYHPLPWHPNSEGIFHSLARLNRRNHRKLWIIDHEIAFVGSMNVSEVHLESVMGERAWRDVGVRLIGPPIVWLRAAFETVWQAHSRARHWHRLAEGTLRTGGGRSGRELVELNLTRASRRRKNRRFIQRIHSAKSRIWLVNPYFVPSFALMLALRRASRRGVDVTIVLPGRSDVFFVTMLARRYFGWLLKHGVHVFEYQPSMIHAKVAIVDDWIRVGSSNLNQRSLLHDLEVNVILCQKGSLKAVEDEFVDHLSRSAPVTLSQWNRRGWLSRGLEAIVELFKRWL